MARPARTDGAARTGRRGGVRARRPTTAASRVATGRSASRDGRDATGSSSTRATGVVDGVPADLEAGRLPGAALADADQLGAVDGPPRPGRGRRSRSSTTTRSSRADPGGPRRAPPGRAPPPTTEPHTIDPIRHIDARTSSATRVTSAGHDHVEPDHLARQRAAPLPRRCAAGRRRRRRARQASTSIVDVVLARTEHERRRGHLVPPDRRARPDRGSAARAATAAGPASVFEREAVQRRAQDASGRYGRHVSGMPLTDTIDPGRGPRRAARTLEPHARPRRACGRAW